jgi:hypothetical protein
MNPVHSSQTLLLNIHFDTESRDNAVGIATGYGLDGRGVGVRDPEGVELFSSPRRPDRFWDYPASYPTGIRGSLPPSNAEAKNMWICAATPPYVFMACLIS